MAVVSGAPDRQSMIAIVGSTGTVGGLLGRMLTADGVPFRALVRRRGVAVGGAEVARADLDEPATLPDALEGVDQLFLVTSGTGPQEAQQVAAIDAAAAAGVDHVVKVSTAGADPEGPFVMGAHGRIEAHLARSGLSATVLRPNSFLQNILRSTRFVEAGDLVDLNGGAAIAYVDAVDVAASAHAVLTGAAARGGVHELTGPRALWPEELAALVSAALGRPVGLVSPGIDDLEAFLLGRGLPPDVARGLVALSRVVAAGALSRVTSGVTDLTGRAPRSVESFVAGRAEALRRLAGDRRS